MTSCRKAASVWASWSFNCSVSTAMLRLLFGNSERRTGHPTIGVGARQDDPRRSERREIAQPENERVLPRIRVVIGPDRFDDEAQPFIQGARRLVGPAHFQGCPHGPF